MTNYDEIIQRLRLDLGNPDPHEPSDDLLMQKLADSVQALRNRASLLGAGLEQDSVSLTLVPNQAVYALNSRADAGRIIRVHVTEYVTPVGTARYIKVPVIERQDIGNYAELSSMWDYPQACIVWAEGGIRKIEFLPMPTRQIACKVWFMIGHQDIGRADSPNGLPEFLHLLRLKAALAALPYCQWSHLRVDDETVPRMDRENLYTARRTELKNDIGAALALEVNSQEQKFDQYLAKTTVGGAESTDLYGMDYLNSYW